MSNPYLLLGFGLALLAVGFGGYRHGVSTTTDHYTALIAESAVESERAVRVALSAAAERERVERERLLTQSDAATVKARADADAARRKATDLSRRIQELSDADPTVDAWRATAVPDSVRGLLATDNHQT